MKVVIRWKDGSWEQIPDATNVHIDGNGSIITIEHDGQWQRVPVSAVKEVIHEKRQ